jgi:hypothetical protein
MTQLSAERWMKAGLLTLCVLVVGCSADRIAKLEKENADLKAKVEKVEKQNVAADYDLQAKCGNEARVWFSQNWERDKDTITLNYENHYSAARNRCFIIVEWHYNSHFAGPGGTSWTSNIDVMDVNQNSKDAHYVENHYIYTKPKISSSDEVITCEVMGNTCKTADEFNNLAAQYMK